MSKGQVKDILVPLQAVIGETQHSLESLSGMGEGTIIELDSLAGEPIDVFAAGELIAKAEVVVIDESFGIRIVEIINRENTNGF
jgi:flagellar motor switch protein FliN/FliY